MLLGHLPGVQMPHEFFPQPGDRLWTPADWAWAGGLLNGLLPGLHFGVPVVAAPRSRSSIPRRRSALMADLGVRNAFLPPTALRMLRAVDDPRGRFDARPAHHRLAAARRSAPRPSPGAARRSASPINEFYGQTECNLVLASCAAHRRVAARRIGKPVPGHAVAVIARRTAAVCAPGELGQIAVLRPDPVMFLGYWNKPEATRGKFVGDWMRPATRAIVDADGYIRFVGRDDDVITSSGYRIGPGEIEDCLIAPPGRRAAPRRSASPIRCAPRSSRRSWS